MISSELQAQSHPLEPIQDEDRAHVKDLTSHMITIEENPFASGGFSDLYKGECTSITQSGGSVKMKVAVKSLRIWYNKPTEIDTTRRRLNRELKVWYMLVNDNILPFLGTFTGKGPLPSLVSPLCENGHVMDYLENRPDADRSPIIKGVANGMYYLHSRTASVVHGDLHPRNVLVDSAGTPRLVDFGRSNIVDHRGYTTNYQGTVRYAAPELAFSDVEQRKPTKPTDVYSFAMTAMEIITGSRPWHGLNDNRVIVQLSLGNRPARANSSITDSVWALMSGCWKENPDERLEMHQVVRDLQRGNFKL